MAARYTGLPWNWDIYAWRGGNTPFLFLLQQDHPNLEYGETRGLSSGLKWEKGQKTPIMFPDLMPSKSPCPAGLT